jgi:L-seryl-tRNA(Ser) seleniumtransferase
MENPLRKLPSISQLLEMQPLQTLVKSVSHNAVTDAARKFIGQMRDQINSTADSFEIPTAQDLAERIANWIRANSLKNSLTPVINGTGVLLHTGLGRAPLPTIAVTAVQSVAEGYSSLEVDLETGQRGHRENAVVDLLRELTGAESAIVVNNNAAATLISLAAIAAGRDVIVSRGQLVEIGGSYRLPEVMMLSQARLVEVGTTNKTRIADYEKAVNDSTGAILRVHSSNYKIVGFTEETPLADLVALARKHSIPMIDDVGSGALIDFSKYGLSDEPVVGRSIKSGADLVLFSGDKLVGGPQCGIIVGRKQFVEKIKQHPLMRAMRVDKMTLAALRAVLELYRHPEKAEIEIPLLSMLATPLDNLKQRAERLGAQIQSCDGIESVTTLDEFSMLGGGSVPTQSISTICLNIVPKGISVDQLATTMRRKAVPLFGRVQNEQYLLDLRTIEPKWDVTLVQLFKKIGDTGNTRAESVD